MYGKVARIYDLLYTGTGIKDYPAESDAFHAIIQESSPGARTLLDVACGTGGLKPHVTPFMPSRDHVVGTKPR